MAGLSGGEHGRHIRQGGAAARDFKIRTEERLFRHPRQSRSNLFLLLSRRRAHVQHVHLDFGLLGGSVRGLLLSRKRPRSKSADKKQDSKKLDSRHAGILNESGRNRNLKSRLGSEEVSCRNSRDPTPTS